MKRLLVALALVGLTGCSTIQTIKEYWPRAHDPVMLYQLVVLDAGVSSIDCLSPDWAPLNGTANYLAKYAEWRMDPQRENIRGLQKHIDKMSQGGSKVFCEIGKKTASQRIQAARSAWEGR